MSTKYYILYVYLFLSLSSAFAHAACDVDRHKAIFTEFPHHVPTDKTVDAPITGNGDIGLTMAPSDGKVDFYVGKNDFWKAVPSYPDGGIALPGGLTISSEIIQEKGYYAEQLPGSAELNATFTNTSNELRIKALVSALNNLVIIELESRKHLKICLNLWAQEGSGSITESGIENGCFWVHRSFDGLEKLLWPTYMAMAMNHNNGDIVLQPGERTIIVVSIYTNHDTERWHEKALEDVFTATNESIRIIKEKHLEWWNSFWNLSEVIFEDDELEKFYYQSQYIFACSSRKGKMAPGIWGPFVTSDEMAFCGDYHLNYNYESPYWASFSSNHICLTENYEAPMLAYMEKGRQHAKNLFQCRGILYPVGLGPKGLCTSAWPKDPERMKAIYGVSDNTIEDGVAFLQQKTNASFVAANMMMHFYSTYDKDYARKIYPFVKACAEFWEDYLVYENEQYVVEGDSFNEHFPWQNYKGDKNSILSLGLIRMVFQSVDTLSRFLKTDRSQRVIWNTIINKLSNYPEGYNSQGRRSFKRNDNEGEIASVINRIYLHGLLLPTGMIGPNITPEYNEIVLSDMKEWHSTDYSDWGTSLGNGIETVYPGAVRVGYPAKALLKHLKKRIKMGSYPNCYIYASGGGIETLSAVPNTINEMMMQSYEGIIRVFPNWDRDMNGSFRDLRAYGAFLVSSSIKNGQIISVILKSEQGLPCKMENPWPNLSVKILKNGKMWRTLEGKNFTFKTKKDDVFEFVI